MRGEDGVRGERRSVRLSTSRPTERVHTHERREHPGYAVPAVLRSVCAYPTRAELRPLLEQLLRLGLDRVASVGAGEGFVEGLLEIEGVEVACVDLDFFAATPQLYEGYRVYTRSGQVVRLGNGAALHEIALPAQTALLFCFGKRLPWEAYLRRFGAAIPLVAIIGDELEGERSVTQPTAHALDCWPGWRLVFDGPCRAVMPARLVLYENLRATSSAPLSSAAL